MSIMLEKSSNFNQKTGWKTWNNICQRNKKLYSCLVCVKQKHLKWNTKMYYRDSPTRFLTSIFFHYLNLPGPLTNGLKYFCRVIQILGKQFDSPGLIPQWDWLTEVCYPGESCLGRFFIDSPGFDTQGRLTRRGIVPGEDWLAGVSYPREINSSGYHNPGRLKNLNNSANS